MLGSQASGRRKLPAGTVGIQGANFHFRRGDDRDDLLLDRSFFVAVLGFRKLAVDREADEAFELLVFAVVESEMQGTDEELLYGPESHLSSSGQDTTELVVGIDVQRQHLIILNYIEAIVVVYALLDFVLVQEIVDLQNLTNDGDGQILETGGLYGFGHELFLLGAFALASVVGSQLINLI